MQREGIFRQSRTLEYPVRANATIGRLEPCTAFVAVHNAVMPTVNSIGSKKTHKKPMLWRPKRVIISRRSSAQITRRWTRQDSDRLVDAILCWDIISHGAPAHQRAAW